MQKTFFIKKSQDLQFSIFSKKWLREYFLEMWNFKGTISFLLRVAKIIFILRYDADNFMSK